MSSNQIHTIRTRARVAAVVALMVWAIPARAAEPVFPVGSRIGLVPPAGMVASPTFMGFEDRDKHAAILLTTFPAEAFDQLDKSMLPEAASLGRRLRTGVFVARAHIEHFALRRRQSARTIPIRPMVPSVCVPAEFTRVGFGSGIVYVFQRRSPLRASSATTLPRAVQHLYFGSPAATNSSAPVETGTYSRPSKSIGLPVMCENGCSSTRVFQSSAPVSASTA